MVIGFLASIAMEAKDVRDNMPTVEVSAPTINILTNKLRIVPSTCDNL